MTDEQLTDLRLTRLEEQATGSRQMERDVDRLKIELPRLENSLKEFRGEATVRHEQLHASLTRLHKRLDDLAAEEHREQGAKAERARLGKWMIAAVSAGTAMAGVIVGIVALLLNNS